MSAAQYIVGEKTFAEHYRRILAETFDICTVRTLYRYDQFSIVHIGVQIAGAQWYCHANQKKMMHPVKKCQLESCDSQEVFLSV